MLSVPETPDFDIYPARKVNHLKVRTFGMEIDWEEGNTSCHHAADVRQYSPDPQTTHSITREPLIGPSDIPIDVSIVAATVSEDGFVEVFWSHWLSDNDSSMRQAFRLMSIMVAIWHPWFGMQSHLIRSRPAMDA